MLLRTVFAAAVLALFWRPVARSMSRSTLRDIGLFAITLGGMNLCFYESLERLPLGIAVTLEFVGPLAVAIAGTRNRLDLLWVVPRRRRASSCSRPTSATGSTRPESHFALTAGAFWGLYILMSARVGRGPAGLGGLDARP